MPKRKKYNVNFSGIALLVCFVISSTAVALALHQIILERRLKNELLSSNLVPKIVGNYSVSLFTTKTTESIIKLQLTADRKATLRYELDKESKELEGSWSGDSNGTVIVSFQDKVFAFSYSPGSTPTLRLLNPDLEIWGARTLTLKRDN